MSSVYLYHLTCNRFILLFHCSIFPTLGFKPGLQANRCSTSELHAQPPPSLKLKADAHLKHAEVLLIFTHSQLTVAYLNLYCIVKHTNQATRDLEVSVCVSRHLLSSFSVVIKEAAFCWKNTDSGRLTTATIRRTGLLKSYKSPISQAVSSSFKQDPPMYFLNCVFIHHYHCLLGTEQDAQNCLSQHPLSKQSTYLQ